MNDDVYINEMIKLIEFHLVSLVRFREQERKLLGDIQKPKTISAFGSEVLLVLVREPYSFGLV